jgi:gliding motility-associated-like protein
MKKLYWFIALFIFSVATFAQPINDDCGGLVDFGAAPICPAPGLYNNVNATESDIGTDNFPGCFVATPERDVWFSFTAVPTITNYEVILTGIADGAGTPSIVNPQIAVYRGDCGVDELVLLDCVSAANGETSISTVLTGLTPGLSYFLRINDWSASATPNSGSFQLCVQEQIMTDFLMTDMTADVCSGTLYDSGGPDGDYSNNENLTFTICPSDPHGCILFTLAEYSIEDNFDEMSFYDGPDTNSPLLGELDGLGSNGGNQMGVCYQVAASSGCLTILFDSDQGVTAAGFVGQWECTTEDCPDDAALTVNTGLDATELAANFTSPLMDITVTNIQCDNEAYGSFLATDATNLGLDDGILLTTGEAAEAANPASFFANNDLNLGGDPDLNFLNQTQGNGMTTDDACFVEMDIFVKTDRLAFDYVMGSEEYKQQFSQFSNDLIGILVSGPGIAGDPGLNGQENIATIPTTGELVQVQTINANDNWQYYRDNNNSQSIAYNGLTTGFMGQPKPMTAIRQVAPCQTYSVKLAIADIDQNDDSGFFVAPSSAGVPQLQVNFNTGIDYLVEGCTNVSDLLVVSLDNPSPVDLTYNVEIGGTATQMEDYILNIPDQITINAGDTELTYALTSIADNIVEGTETIEISLVADFGCGEIDLTSFSIDLTEELVIDVNNGVDTVFVCEGINSTQLNAVGAAGFVWSPANLFDNPNSANPTVTINNSQMVTVTGTLGTCTATDQVFLQIISPEVNIEIQNGGDNQLCQGENIVLFANNNVGNSGLEWTPTQPIPNAQTLNLSPTFTTTYTATVATSGCSATDELTVTVEPFSPPTITTTDTTICQNSSVLLATAAPGAGTTYEWSPVDGLDNPNIVNATATPDQTTTYTLTATSINGVCTETATTTINVLPANVDIAEDNFNICLGESVTFTANTSTNGVGLTWSPADSLSSTTDVTVTANPSVSTWYVATLEVGACVVFDSVLVRVDSLPDLVITAIPGDSPYCEGEIISMVSPGYEDLNFQNISHQWSPSVGAQSTDTLLNFVVAATETTTYTRTTQNGACMDVSEIFIEVIPTPEITVMPNQATLCAGESIDLLATSPDITEFEWSPSAGLSCTECPNPTATPPGTITYNVTGEFMGCPANATVFLEISDGPVLNVPDQTICPETSVTLNGAPAEANTTYEWTLEDGTFFSDEAQPEVEDLTETTTYLLTVDNGGCDPVMESITINVVQEPTLTLSDFDALICEGLSTTLTANVNTPGGTFAWSPNGQTDASITVSPTTTTEYSVIYTSPLGCFVTDAQSGTVTVNPSFDLDSLNANPTMGFEGEDVTLTAFINPDSTQLINGVYTWSLQGEDPFESTMENNVVTANPQIDDDNQQEILVTYQVSVTDDAGCVQSADVTVIVMNSIAEMPNAFTPNGDGNNDVFNLVQSPNVTVSDFRIYNRWGKEVYTLSDNPDGWDGTINGDPASADVYIYIMEYEFAGVMETLKGDVTLIR